MAGLLVLGLAAIPLCAPTGTLAAAPAGSQFDADADGLSDLQELVLQSSPLSNDTDGDGYCDTEELARGSCAYAASDVPLPAELDMAMAARGEAGSLRVSVAVYFTDGTIANKSLEFGVLIGDSTVIEVPAGHLTSSARMKVLPSLDGLGDMLVLDFALPTSLIYQLGHLTLFAMLSIDGQGCVASAAVIDFFVTPDGVLMQSGPVHGPLHAMRGDGGNSGGGGLYQPIPPGGDLPIGWVPGRICHQRTEPIGYADGIVTKRVTEAECVDGWDSFCSAVECKGSVGDEYATIDPVGLVGG